MVFAGERYYNINRIILTTIGLWPYHKPSILHTAFFIGTYASSIFFQLTIFLRAKCDFEVFINVLSSLCMTFLYFLNYNCIFFNMEKIKQLFEQIKADWDAVKNTEIRILEKYAIQSRLMTLLLVSFSVAGMIMIVFIELLPVILDAVAPMNESRPRKTKWDFEMLLDQQQYFYVYLAHEIVVMIAGFSTIVGMSTLGLTFLRHSCATYKIASTLIGSTVTKHTLEIPPDQKIREMYRRITRAVRTHKRTVQFTKFLLNSMDKWFFVMMGFAVLSLSCNLLRFRTSMTVIKEFSEKLFNCGLVFGHFLIIFLFNFVGQTIINHSAEMFTAAYNTTWYLAPLPIQKLLLFIMQYSLKANTLLVGGLFIASLEGFSTLTATSISYFTVLYSMN